MGAGMGVLRDRSIVPGGAALVTRAGRLVAGTRDEVPALRRVLASPRLRLGQGGRTGPAAAGAASAAAAEGGQPPPVPGPAAGAFFHVDNTPMRRAASY